MISMMGGAAHSGCLRDADGSSIPCAYGAFEDAGAASAYAAEMIVAAATAKPDLVLCLATGATPERCYDLLAARAAADPALFARARIVKLDEWLGLPTDHGATCEAYLRSRVLGPWGIDHRDGDRYVGFNAATAEPDAECARVDATLASWGGIDVALLGLGLNGHVGLNEPSDRAEGALGPTRAVDLAAPTREHAMLAGVDGVTRGLTLGIDALAAARTTALLVLGRRKRPALAAAVDRARSPLRPASLLLRAAAPPTTTPPPAVRLLCDVLAATDAMLGAGA